MVGEVDAGPRSRALHGDYSHASAMSWAKVTPHVAACAFACMRSYSSTFMVVRIVSFLRDR
jgi:hypothetical protein